MENQTEEDRQRIYNGVILWGTIDTFIIIFTLSGNVLTLCAIALSRKLSSVISNHFIFSLALADILVALLMPYHYAFYVLDYLGANKSTCLLRFVLICLACSCSIYNLLAIAGDRYVAIVYPLHYGRYMTKRAAMGVILMGWVVSFTHATVPVYWNGWDERSRCELNEVLSKEYVNYVMTPMFGLIWLAMLLLYLRIWREASGHAKRMRNTTCYGSGAVPSDSKSVQVMGLSRKTVF